MLTAPKKGIPYYQVKPRPTAKNAVPSVPVPLLKIISNTHCKRANADDRTGTLFWGMLGILCTKLSCIPLTGPTRTCSFWKQTTHNLHYCIMRTVTASHTDSTQHTSAHTHIHTHIALGRVHCQRQGHANPAAVKWVLPEDTATPPSSLWPRLHVRYNLSISPSKTQGIDGVLSTSTPATACFNGTGYMAHIWSCRCGS